MFFIHPRWPLFHEDNHLLVLYKPAGLIMQRGNAFKHNLLDLAKWWLKERYAKPGRVYVGMVHRLDAPVAGVMVLARTSKAAARLSEQFRSGTIEKVYLAVTQSRPAETQGRLINYLLRKGRFSSIAPPETPGAQKAILSYQQIAAYENRSLLQIVLETGRRHQIRAQLAAIGCPILGDRHYGAEQFLPHGRIALLATRLQFSHPTQGTQMTFDCPCPEGWPWRLTGSDLNHPLWTLETLEQFGLDLPPAHRLFRQVDHR